VSITLTDVGLRPSLTRTRHPRFAVRFGAHEFRDIADGCGLGRDLPTFSGQGGPFGLEVSNGDTLALTLTRERLTAFALPLDGRQRGWLRKQTEVRALLKITVRHQRGHIRPHLCPSN
jgi:hypothetical protein